MEKWEDSKDWKCSVEDSKDEEPQDPPPPYEEQLPTEPGPSKATSSWSTSKRVAFQIPTFSRPEERVRFYTPHPERVMCACGKHNDTTQRSWLLPSGKVYCACGYIVTSFGYSYYPPNPKDVPEPSPPKCSCGTQLPKQLRGDRFFLCPCGAQFRPDGSVQRFCEYHQLYASDAQNVRCDCGRFVNTTAEWTIRHGHGTRFDGDKRIQGAGYTMFEYILPKDSGKCSCGRTIRRDGTSSMKHNNYCCKVWEVSEKDAVAGSEESCTCAYL